MRDRLIELLKQKACHYVLCDNECGGCKNVEMYDDSIESIADHLLANGVIVPPVKVGQTVWFVRNLGDKSREKIEETRVEKIVLKSGGLYIKLGCNSMYETTCNSIGKTVFLTREEAEQALKGE